LFGVPVVQTTQIAAGTGPSIRGGVAVYWTRLSMLIIYDPYTELRATARWPEWHKVRWKLRWCC
jgi:hypothetical protein